ncbi:flavoprotein [Roridomyces roridus]|uniref:Flavoprotein n=1 Tax=Roridomyces roridus TaxID=1738132 RepID=A0AAD7C2S8_9AGAR|nr:flavoprotein [Roridomyces roridus]
MSTTTFIAEAERRPGHTHRPVKAPLIVEELLRYERVKVQVVATKPSLAFYDPEVIRAKDVPVWTDQDEWPAAYKIGDPILHIELRRWADIVLVAPCSANTLSKIGAWDHPLTAEHLRIVRDVVKYNVVGPIGKLLACGDLGMGAMTEWRDIVQVVVDKFNLALAV